MLHKGIDLSAFFETRFELLLLWLGNFIFESVNTYLIMAFKKRMMIIVRMKFYSYSSRYLSRWNYASLDIDYGSFFSQGVETVVNLESSYRDLRKLIS